MATVLSLPITNNPSQAVVQVQNRLDSAFGRRRIPIEFVRDSVTAALTELIITLSDDLPPEEVAGFRRSLTFIDGRGGLAVDPPSGVGGSVSAARTTGFDASFAIPTGISFLGSVSIGGGGTSGPTTIHTDGGFAATHDLSTTAIATDLPIQPGTLVLSGTIAMATQTATDDGAGVFPTSVLLPAGGTINYATGAMTGITANLGVATALNETHQVDASLTPSNAVILASGAAIGNAGLRETPVKAIGRPLASLEWSFNLQFSTDFGLNNNAVSGPQTLTLEARLLGALATGQSIVLRWVALSGDAMAPAAWGTPTFVAALPTTTPTGALAINIDAVYHKITIRFVSARVLGVSYDGVEELFTFAADMVVPSAVVLNHNWAAALDRNFSVDEWTLSYALPAPAAL